MSQLAYKWMSFLEHIGPMVVLPLLVGAAVLMLFGWRLWRVSAAFTYALAGIIVAHLLLGSSGTPWLCALGAALAGGAVGYVLGLHAIALLGAAAGAGILAHVIGGFHLPQAALWVGGGLGAFLGWGLAHLNLRQVTIVLTALEGSVLLVSALAVLSMSAPSVYRSFAGFAEQSAFLVGFVVLVPTVVSCFYQMSDVRRSAATALAERRSGPPS
ncbi:MAG: hypothetical protein KKI08_05180 [Armatimonadetes bacterium]|nr:hypothetical protein [Armatimonadota bacterium]